MPNASRAPTPKLTWQHACLVPHPQGGDWSAVIDQQTRATLPAGAAAAVVAAGSIEDTASGALTSPFTQAGVHRKIGEGVSQVWHTEGVRFDQRRPSQHAPLSRPAILHVCPWLALHLGRPHPWPCGPHPPRALR
jgi:hypothetical protein